MSWFVDEKILDSAIKHNQLIQEEEVECQPEKVSDAVVDDNVDVHVVRKYFTNDAWMVVEEVMKLKLDKMNWICHSCSHDLHTEESIICDSCLLWYHFTCASLIRKPKTKNWFCRECYAKIL